MTTEVDSFNCTEVELDSLISHIKFISASVESRHSLLESNEQLSKSPNATAQAQWVVDMIPCSTENGEAARAYLANVYSANNRARRFRAHADRVRCPTTSQA